MKDNFKPGRDKVLLMDGAMGTELIREGLDLSLPLWSGDINLTHPGYVSKIHEEYVQAGADIVTTNTFRTSPRTYIHAGYSKLEARERARKSLNSAVDLAKKAAGEKCYVAGSIAPLEDCYSPERFPGDEEALGEFYELGKWLASAGVDFLLFETMGCGKEINAVLQATSDINIPRWISLILKNGNTLLDGSSLRETLFELRNKGIEKVLLNCNVLRVTGEGLEIIKELWKNSWGVYPNAGLKMPSKGGHISSTVSMNQFVTEMRRFLKMGAQVVGACCGSTPSHILELRKCVDIFTKGES